MGLKIELIAFPLFLFLTTVLSFHHSRYSRIPSFRPVSYISRIRFFDVSGNGMDGSFNLGGQVEQATEAAKDALFQELLNSNLQTLSTVTKCSRALVYLQSEKDQLLHVVCSYPPHKTIDPAEEFVPLDCIIPSNYLSLDCIPNASGVDVYDYPIIYYPAKGADLDATEEDGHDREPDYYGLLRIEYDKDVSNHDDNVLSADLLAKSIAHSMALSIKLEYTHFSLVSSLEQELLPEATQEAMFSSALITNIWTTASNSIRTMRTMLKMLERRNIREGDDIGKETYDNIQVQLESLGMSIAPLMPSLFAPVENVMENYDSIINVVDEEEVERDGEEVTPKSMGASAVDTPLTLRSDLWASNKEESSVVYDSSEDPSSDNSQVRD